MRACKFLHLHPPSKFQIYIMKLRVVSLTQNFVGKLLQCHRFHFSLIQKTKIKRFISSLHGSQKQKYYFENNEHQKTVFIKENLMIQGVKKQQEKCSLKKKCSNYIFQTITLYVEKVELVLMYFHFCKLHILQNGMHILFYYHPLSL